MDSLNNNIKSMEYSIKQFYKHNAYSLSISDMKFPNGALFTHKGASQCRYNNDQYYWQIPTPIWD